jgi:2-oxoglutarate ferredoxin oxidoreductase subunit alpha
VQRGGPSTGQPTKTEQGDLMSAIYGSHGDAPKVVMAVSTIEDCFYSIITARKIAETFNMVVIVLSDATLATSQQPFKRPEFSESWIAPPIDQSAIANGAKPYDWDETTGLARRFIPGQPGGMHTVTGLAHDNDSHVAYDADTNERSLHARSLKLAALQKTLKTPPVFGADTGDLLIVGWGSTKGAIEEAVEELQKEGKKVSSLHLQFLQPLPSGIKEIMQKFKKVMTIENNWSDRIEDEIIDEANRRYSSMAILLRSRYLIDIDCWSESRGQPIKPSTVYKVISDRMKN